MLILAQAAPQMPQLPPLPEGPDLARLRAPAEATATPELLPIILAVVATVLIVLLFTWLVLRSRRKNVPQIDPRVAALSEIETAQHIAKDDISYASVCSSAVKRLLAEQYNISQGRGYTSEELLKKLPIESSNKAELREFLEKCDSVKFAKNQLHENERQSIAAKARAIVDAHHGKELAR